MSKTLFGKDILIALIELKSPATLMEIVSYLSAKNKGSQTELSEKIQTILNSGVEFGFIKEQENKYSIEELIYKDSEFTQTEAENINEERASTHVSPIKKISTSSEKVLKKPSTHISESDHDADSCDDNEVNNKNEQDEFSDQEDCYNPQLTRKRSRSRSKSKRRTSRHIKRRRRLGTRRRTPTGSRKTKA